MDTKITFKWKIITYIYSSCILFFFTNNARQHADKTKPKIAIISLYNSQYQRIGKYSDWNKKAYAKKHGYDLFLYHTVLDNTRPPAWSKILAIQKHLAHYDWVYWSDADSLIMNSEVKLESIIDNSFDLIITQESAKPNYLNTGSFLIRNSQWSKNFLKNIYEQVDFINNPLWEQAALMYLIEKQPSYLEHIKKLHQKVMNSHLHHEDIIYEPGDFILHFYGPDKFLKEAFGKEKSGLMKKYYNQALNTELQKTTGWSENYLAKILKKINKLESKFMKKRKESLEILPFLIDKYNLKVGCLLGLDFGIHSENILRNTNIHKLYCIGSFDPSDFDESSDDNFLQDLITIINQKINRCLDVFEDKVEYMQLASKKAYDKFDNEELDFVFINTPENDLENLENLYKKIKRGGIYAGYGYSSSFAKVKLAIIKFIAPQNAKIEHENGVWWIVKS